jgi:rhodanese-related sulfurtransferase
MLQGRPVSGKRAQRLVEQGALLIDTRDPVSYRDGTLPGAINMHLRQVSSLFKHPKNTKMVIFGNTADDTTTHAIVNYLRQYGFTEVFTMNTKEDWNV